MKSLTKNNQSMDCISKIIKKHIKEDQVACVKELTEGYFNVAYEVELLSGRSVILKVAPKKGVRIMTYENNIMHTEIEAMLHAARKKMIPVPAILGWDDSCEICSAPYFLMEKLRGKSLFSVKESLSEEELKNIYVESGKICREINQITCPKFGYPGQKEYQSDDWYTAFKKMLASGVWDAKRALVDIKLEEEKIWSCLKRDKAIFDEVDNPCLVHWDCWDGNIFVDHGRITGIIDWERALWADPLMEVGFRTYEDHAWFQKGYGIECLSKNQRKRALWYDVYLLILMSLECEYRNYDTMEMYEWATGLLMEQFNKIIMD